ncbi:MAG: class I SAM-dependent methyltransferase [Microthrixaceae bacterium]|nr:class I SAM-dependent methyltransferase [Microthrixaceae bacterium]
MVRFSEGGLAFEADVCKGHKTGHFLDQRDNRARLRKVSTGARVLDVYACTGGFSVNAAAGGAKLVHRVDVSSPALAAASRNMALNRSLPQVRRCREEDTAGDAMAVMAGLTRSRRRFDIVVVDPPAFASRRAHVPRALRSYGSLTELALQLVEPGGLLVQSSCSTRVGADEFESAIRGAAERSGVRLTEVARTAHGVDHPVGFAQGAYLKAVFAKVWPLHR